MFKLLFAAVGITIFSTAQGQQKQIDSLFSLLNTQQHDTIRANLYDDIAHYYVDNNYSLAIQYFFKEIDIQKKQHNSRKLADNYYNIGYCYRQQGDLIRSLDNYLKSASIYAQLKATAKLINAYLSVTNLYMDNNEYKKSGEYLNEAEKLTYKIKNDMRLSVVLDEKGLLFDHLSMYDSALIYHRKAYNLSIGKNDAYSTVSYMSNLGLTYKHLHNTLKAMSCFNIAMAITNKKNMPADIKGMVYNNIAVTYADEGNYAAARQNFDKSISLGRSVGVQGVVLENYRNLADMYGRIKDYRQESFYLKKYYTLKDSLFSSDTKNQLTQLESNFRIGQKNELITEQQRKLEKQTGQRNMFFVIAAGAAVLLVISVVFYGLTRKNNNLLLEKNKQINEQKDKLENTLADLKATQSQLIQSEKMASLGELTAGIAHEIQNPLNFVNNFSEVGNELIDEMKDELAKGNYEDVNAIAHDLKQNLEKINQHGKRADAIVKGMLQHSRASSGHKEPTHLNALCDEYMRACYHSLRAKDNGFSADCKVDFDETLPAINIVPQDIGRVLLNLFSNAFYAVKEKNISASQATRAGAYQPTVSIRTKKVNDKVEIKVSDNGNGMPQNIVSKIFQPFFTTKPTGQGTGLGLSLAYDIIKAHGGEINVQTKEGEGTTFIVLLPIKNG